jgi:hypothetical protein
MDTAAGIVHSPLSEGQAEGWTRADAAGDDATRLRPLALVCPEQSDGRGGVLR